MLRRNVIQKFKKYFESNLKSIAIHGRENIKSELTKIGQDADVSYTINKNKIQFIVEPKTTKIETENLPYKETAKLKDVLGPVPIEMLNEEISQQRFSTEAVNKAMERTKEDLKKRVDRIVKKNY